MENYIEDPLSEELLKGEFQGKEKIVVDVVKNDEGKVRRLKFVGANAKSEQEPATAAAGETSGSQDPSNA